MLLPKSRASAASAFRNGPTSRAAVKLQSGSIAVYAFAMLIGAAAFITWFMFAMH